MVFGTFLGGDYYCCGGLSKFGYDGSKLELRKLLLMKFNLGSDIDLFLAILFAGTTYEGLCV